MRSTHLALLLLALACTTASDPGVPATVGPPAGGSSSAAGAGSGAGGGAGAPALSVERLDPDPECDGLVPAAIPDPVTVALAPPAGGGCVGGTSDGTGAVALGVRDAGGAVTWRAHAPDGAPRGSFAAEWPLLSQPAGWHALDVSRPPFGADPTVDLVAISPSGDVASRQRVTPDPSVGVGPRWSLAADPAGGSAVAVRWTYVAGNHWSAVAVQRFDAAGARRWTTDPPALTLASPGDAMFLGAGVARGGDVLLVAQQSASVDVAWLDAGGSATAPAAQEPSQPVAGDGLSHALELAPLLDGSVAVRSDLTWRRTYAPRAGASAPLPGWLAARPGDALRTTRGGLGYALLPPAGGAAPDCASRVDLVSRGGRTCGRITIRDAGAACVVRSVDQGWDGTLVAQSAADACTVRWWPGLLRP